MDNLPVHHASLIHEAIAAVGAPVVFLPPDSPDLSLIELYWSKLKPLLRSVKARTSEALDQALSKIISECISDEDALGWFAHCSLPHPKTAVDAFAQKRSPETLRGLTTSSADFQ